jgi:hypothetical protein
MTDTLEEILLDIRAAADIGWPGHGTIYMRWATSSAGSTGWRATLDNDKLYGLGTTPTIASSALLGVMRRTAREKAQGHEKQTAKWRSVLGREMNN